MNCTIKILARGEMTTIKKERTAKKPLKIREFCFFWGVSYAETLNGIHLLFMLINWLTASVDLDKAKTNYFQFYSSRIIKRN